MSEREAVDETPAGLSVRGTRQGDTVYGDDGRVVHAPRRPKPTPPVFKQQE